MGDDKTVESISTGGFLLDVDFTATGLRELAKMDGAIVCDREANADLRAGVHLMPDPPSSPRRPAPGTARQIGSPGRPASLSSRCRLPCTSSRCTSDRPATSWRTPPPSGSGQPGAATLERYRSRLDEVSDALSALEIEDLVTVRDVAAVAQRLEMVIRIARRSRPTCSSSAPMAACCRCSSMS